MYLWIGEDGAEGMPQVSPESKSVHDEVFLPGGQLQKASEALEASVVVVLQVNSHLFGHREMLHHSVQGGLGFYKAERRVVQSLQQHRVWVRRRAFHHTSHSFMILANDHQAFIGDMLMIQEL